MKRAKIKDKSWSGKTVQENGNGKDQGQGGFCEAYLDQEDDQSKKRFPIPEIRRKIGRKRGKETDSLPLNFLRGYVLILIDWQTNETKAS
jgi:hypothetical protein